GGVENGRVVGRPGGRRLHAVAGGEDALLSPRAVEDDDLGKAAVTPANRGNSVTAMRPARLVPLLVEPAGRDWHDASPVARDAGEPRAARNGLHGNDLAVGPRVGHRETRPPR